MNEEEVQRRRREQDENATRERAAILGLQYLDTRELEQSLALVNGLLSVEEMHRDRMIPLTMGDDQTVYQLGVTAQTPQSAMQKLTRSCLLYTSRCV